MSSIDIKQIKQLLIAERVALVEDIWDSIAEDTERVDMPAWHRSVLRERLAKYSDRPKTGTVWAEVRRRIEQEQ